MNIDINAQLSNVTVKARQISATLRISLETGLADQLIAYFGKDLKLYHKVGAKELHIHFGNNATLHGDSTASIAITVKRAPGVIDWMIDIDEEEYYDFALEVDFVQQALAPAVEPRDDDDDARPSADAIAEADGIRTFSPTPTPAQV